MKSLKYQLKSIRRDKLCLLTFLLPIVVGLAINLLSGVDFDSLGETSFGVLEGQISQEAAAWLQASGTVTRYGTEQALREAVKAGTGDREKLLALGRDVFNEVKREIGPETQEIIVKLLGSFDHYLEQCIENAVLKIKQADPYITLPGALVDGVGEAELKEGVGGAVAE